MEDEKEKIGKLKMLMLYIVDKSCESKWAEHPF